MYNQAELILAQYEIEIKQTTKGRGSYICDTDKGKRVLLPFRGSPERGEALKQYLESLSELGFETEGIYETREGKAVSNLYLQEISESYKLTQMPGHVILKYWRFAVF